MGGGFVPKIDKGSVGIKLGHIQGKNNAPICPYVILPINYFPYEMVARIKKYVGWGSNMTLDANNYFCFKQLLYEPC